METMQITLKPLSAFGSAIKGDTLFGQMCWAIRNRFGVNQLNELLQDYTNNRPFAVISDAFPRAWLPRPALPLSFFDKLMDVERKQIKKLNWMPVEAFKQPIKSWLAYCKAETDIIEGDNSSLQTEIMQPHNSISRLTGTTGKGDFAPYTMARYWFPTDNQLLIYCCFDAERIERDDILQVLEDIGSIGYGRDASIGLGKYVIVDTIKDPWPTQDQPNSYMTLAPCAPQGLAFEAGHSFYQPFTRFGRHGDMGVHAGHPFKTPLLLTNSAAILTPKEFHNTPYIGRGLGGNGQLSRAIQETVHQAYTPVLAVQLPKHEVTDS